MQLTRQQIAEQLGVTLVKLENIIIYNKSANFPAPINTGTPVLYNAAEVDAWGALNNASAIKWVQTPKNGKRIEKENEMAALAVAFLKTPRLTMRVLAVKHGSRGQSQTVSVGSHYE